MKNYNIEYKLFETARELEMDTEQLMKDARELCMNSNVKEKQKSLNECFQYPDVWECALFVLVGLKAFKKNYPVITEDTKVCYGAYNSMDGMSSTGFVSNDMKLFFISDGPYAYGSKMSPYDLNDQEKLMKVMMDESVYPEFATLYLKGFFDQMIKKIK